MDTTMTNDDPSVVVAVRLRPLNEKEKCDAKGEKNDLIFPVTEICISSDEYSDILVLGFEQFFKNVFVRSCFVHLVQK